MRQAFVLQSMARAGRGGGLPPSTTEMGTSALLRTSVMLGNKSPPLIQGVYG